MSLLGKKWIILNTDSKKSTLEKILNNRESIEDDLTEFYDPFLFRDMEKTVLRIEKAIKNQERIIVFGDYDVDGITGTAILYKILKKINANVSCRIPNREKDGYGLSKKFIKEFIEKEIKLVITVDCGISCADIVTDLKENKIETIITDHHTIPKDLPLDAVAILHPGEKGGSYPYTNLTGAGVAFKLAHALINRFVEESEREKFLNSLLDLASLGTVADLGPINNENKLIVKKGLKVLAKTEWIGLKKIMEMAGVDKNKEIDSTAIGFRIAPRINAAGRIDSPYVALNLLLQEENNSKVSFLGAKLEELNSLRQDMTNKAVFEAESEFKNMKPLPFILISKSPDWHVGIVGLVAGRLAERYARPSIIFQDNGETLVGSARSPEEFNITQAMALCKELLINFGGHSCAGGLSIKKENLKAFTEKISKYAKSKLKNSDFKPKLMIDCLIKEDEIGFEIINELEKLKPFGIKNEKPVFLLKNVEPMFISQVGKEAKHLKFSIRVKEKTINIIAFNMGMHAEKIKTHRKINMATCLEKNIWNNRESLQLQVLDIELHQK